MVEETQQAETTNGWGDEGRREEERDAEETRVNDFFLFFSGLQEEEMHHVRMWESSRHKHRFDALIVWRLWKAWWVCLTTLLAETSRNSPVFKQPDTTRVYGSSDCLFFIFLFFQSVIPLPPLSLTLPLHQKSIHFLLFVLGLVTEFTCCVCLPAVKRYILSVLAALSEFGWCEIQLINKTNSK